MGSMADNPWATIPGGVFAMGHDGPEANLGDGEGPVHPVDLDSFLLAAVTVTNERFARFVADTGHVTDAETHGWSFVFGGLLPDDFEPTRGVASAPWWRQVHGADWRHPEGPRSDLDTRGDHPVVHVSWHDAAAFCQWDGSRLPTEAEWERAARGGLERRVFPWGDEREPGGRHRMNVWQGSFPDRNTVDDGHVGTAPVDAFEPNGFGLHQMCGNVWEWCHDWFDPGTYAVGPYPRRNPRGPDHGRGRVMRGGSYLCHDSYCNRYRVAARTSSGPTSSSGNTGFRVARSFPAEGAADHRPA